MGWYHALAAEVGDTPKTIYHMCPKADYEASQKGKDRVYFPKAYDTDKFTRATHEPQRLMETANCFYQASAPADQEWVCLEIDTMGLKVNGFEVKMQDSETQPELKCPHIYGGLPEEAVKKVYDIQRHKETGEFLFVTGLTDQCGCSGGKAAAKEVTA